MAESVHDVAAAILERLGPLDAWRFQKLVYYSQAWHLARHGQPLFNEEIQAWANGPVVRPLYKKGTFSVSRWQRGNPARLGKVAHETIDWVLDHYGQFTGEQLSIMTHTEAPWRVARAGIPEGASSDAPIGQGIMAEYYARLLQSPREATAMAVGNALLEGYEFDDEAIRRLDDVATGQSSADDAVAEVLARYSGPGRQR